MTVEKLTVARDYALDTSQPTEWRALNAALVIIEYLEELTHKACPPPSTAGLRHNPNDPPDYMGMVREFHEMTGQPIGRGCPWIENWKACISRLRLISEEFGELVKAMDTYPETRMASVADALADLLYVVFGTAVAFGLPMDEIFRQVHESNMTKNGGSMEGGKWIKPSTYKPVDLSWVNDWRPEESK